MNHNLELRKFFKFCVAHLPVERETKRAAIDNLVQAGDTRCPGRPIPVVRQRKFGSIFSPSPSQTLLLFVHPEKIPSSRTLKLISQSVVDILLGS